MKGERVLSAMRHDRKTLSWQTGLAALAVTCVMAVCVHAANSQSAAPAAQNAAPAATAPASPTDVAGIWQGTLHIAQANRDLRTEIKIAKNADGSYKLTLYSIDQGGQPLVADKTTFEGGKLAFAMDAM